GNRAHLMLESAITLGWDAKGANIQRVAAEIIVDDKGIIRAVGQNPGSFGKQAANWRTLDAALLKSGVVNAQGRAGTSTLIGQKASDVIEVGIDYKTRSADMEGVKKMESLIGAPYVRLAKGGNVESAILKRLASIGKANAKAVAALATEEAKTVKSAG